MEGRKQDETDPTISCRRPADWTPTGHTHGAAEDKKESTGVKEDETQGRRGHSGGQDQAEWVYIDKSWASIAVAESDWACLAVSEPLAAPLVELGLH